MIGPININVKTIMKNKINILLACLVVVGMAACDTAGGIDADIFVPGESAALAVWVSSPSGDLLLSDPTATVDFEVEFLDETDGSSVEAFTMTVTDGTNTGTLINQTAFTANANGNQGFSGSISMNAIAAALGTTVASYSEEDEFDFVSTITRGGTVFPSGNSLFSVRDFTLETPVETVDVTVTIKNEFLNGAATGTVVMAFENDFGVELETFPTLTITSGSGSFGAVTAVLDEDDEDSVYQAVYTPGAVEEKISFTITGASAVTAAGFAMATETVTDAFTVDLTAPQLLGNNSAASATGQLYNFLLDENIGSVSLLENFTGVDDDGDGTIDEAGEGEKVEVTFSDNFFNFKYDWKAADGEVTLTLEVEDAAGNAVALPAGLATVVLN